MKILVIGNGFDLDHNLPTGYYEFIKFCDNIIRFKTDKSLKLVNLSPYQEKYFDKLREDSNLLDNFYSLLENNNLYKYFSDLSKTNNWIDMEAEILSILTDLDKLEEKMLTDNITEMQIPRNNTSYKNLTKLLHPNDIPLFNNLAISITRKSLFAWLNNISIALEMYISYFINETPIEYYSPDIIDFDADRIITFNYSNTYEKIYTPSANNNICNYIHGKASNKIVNNNSNIVLGITDPLIEHDKRSVDSKFEKYFQRIIKGTSNKYKQWLKTNEKVEIAFFGHSLFSSDGDIIQELIKRSNKITIFYYDLKMYYDTITHLVEIIGKEELKNYVHSDSPKIEFKKQQNHLSIEESEINLPQDLARLRCFYNNKSDHTITIVDRIKEKLNSEDIKYFQSQKLVIELYFELISHNIDITNSQHLLKITHQLDYMDSHSRVITYNRNSYNFSQNISIINEGDFCCLIDTINNDNLERFNSNRYTTYFFKDQFE